MKKFFLTISSVIIVLILNGQSEFTVHKNGLIYSEVTMNKLTYIVDSLNLKYKTCDLDKVFNSKTQTIGYYVKLKKKDVLKAKKDIENNISIESFMAKYSHAKIEKDVLIVKFKYTHDNDPIVEYSKIGIGNSYGYDIQETNSKVDEPKKNTWIYDYYSGSDYTEESITAFYFPNEFKSIPLSNKYSRQIGYSECLIDTSSTKFLKETKSGSIDLPKDWLNLSQKKKKKLLNEMRSTRLIGFCSMDNSPRIHAINIALLSAETTNWEVFLKSHLDIMNDRFDRMSDGSYAWDKRKTYIKELEELNINVSDLLIGISLRTENPSKNHYYGSISRIGRAISESNNVELFETEILAMVKDNDLDDYNRVLSYYLFLNYNSYLEDENKKADNEIKLELAAKEMPDYLMNQIKKN